MQLMEHCKLQTRHLQIIRHKFSAKDLTGNYKLEVEAPEVGYLGVSTSFMIKGCDLCDKPCLLMIPLSIVIKGGRAHGHTRKS